MNKFINPIIILALSLLLMYAGNELGSLNAKNYELEQNYGFCMDTLDFFINNPEHEYERPTVLYPQI